MGSGVNWIETVTLSTPTAGAWTDVDVSEYVPADATGVIIRFRNDTAASRVFGLRKNGSTDNRTGTTTASSMNEGFIGIDANKILEYYISTNTVSCLVELLGYTGSDFTFNTNGVDKSTSTTGSWVDVDCAANAPNATGLIFEVKSTNIAYTIGLRVNGSTDDIKAQTWGRFISCTGCDSSQICEQNISSTSVDLFLIGYMIAGITWLTNKTNVTPGSNGVWTDVATASGALGGIILVKTTNEEVNYGIRKNGSGEDIKKYIRYQGNATAQADESGIFEVYLGNKTYMSFYLVGYMIESRSWGGTWGG